MKREETEENRDKNTGSLNESYQRTPSTCTCVTRLVLISAIN